MGKYGDGKKSKEAIKKSRLLDQEFKKAQNEPHDEQAALDRYSRNQIEEIKETIQQYYDGFHKTVQKIVKSLNKSDKICELSIAEHENFIRPINIFLRSLKAGDWILYESNQQDVLMDCCTLLISLLRAKRFILDSVVTEMLWLVQDHIKRYLLNIADGSTPEDFLAQIEKRCRKEIAYDSMQKKCKAGTASAVNYRVDQYNNEPLPYIKRNIRHNKKEEQMLKVYKHITQKGKKQIGLLAELFCKFYNKSTDWKDIIIANLHAIIASAVGRVEYLTFLPLYFFFWFVKKSDYLLSDHSNEDATRHNLYPPISFTKEEQENFSQKKYIELFNDIVGVLTTDNDPIDNQAAEPSIWPQISGAAIGNTKSDKKLNRYFEMKLFHDRLNNIPPSDNYSILEGMELLAYPMSDSRRKELDGKKFSSQMNQEIRDIISILDPAIHIAMVCQVPLITQKANAIDHVYAMLQSETFRISQDNESMLKWIESEFVETDYVEDASDKLSTADKYKYICQYLDIEYVDLSTVGMRLELNIPANTVLAGEDKEKDFRNNIRNFTNAIEVHRESLYPQWFKDYQDNHSILSPSEQIYVLNKREKIVRHAWKIEDYIKFTQIYTDKSTFTHWIQTQIQEDSNISTASQNTNKPKAKKPDAESDLYNNVVETEALRNHISAAAFYQMISNLIYFMREKMLSLL